MIPEWRLGQPSPLTLYLNAAILESRAALLTPHNVSPSIALDRLRQFEAGIKKWQRHSYRRTTPEPATIWKHSSSRLLDYGASLQGENPDGLPVFVIPSLINPAHILDLTPERSLLHYLASQGMRPMLLDWGAPTDRERKYDLDAYTKLRLLPAIQAAKNATGQDINLLGYCMGGTLGAGVLANGLSGIRSFTAIGAPWDFQQYGRHKEAELHTSSDNTAAVLDNIGSTFGMVPALVFQTIFAIISPTQAAEKFQKFNAMDEDSPEAHLFVAVEDWLAKGAPVPTLAAKNLIVNWGIDNQTAKNAWPLMGDVVDLDRIAQPTLVICGKHDSITPMPVATPLASGIKNSQLLTPDLGHVGLIVSSTAKKEVWNPIVDFIKKPWRPNIT